MPGRNAEKRISSWLAKLEVEADAFADEKGRDAFAFDPIESPCLDASQSELRVRITLFEDRGRRASGSAILALGRRQSLLCCSVPFIRGSSTPLAWPAIETAARRNEPDVRKARYQARKGTEIAEASKARARERRRKRYPVPLADHPPLARAVATRIGVVVFTGTDGEIAEPETVAAYYFPNDVGELVWTAGGPDCEKS